MSEQDKFYTPTIEDFHVGFECEIFENEKWNNHTLHKGDLNGLFYYKTLHQNNLRVKYLDQQDLESLGWNFEGKNGFTINKKFWLDLYDKDKFSCNIHIEEGSSLGTFEMEEVDTLFHGTIKNKSELKKLMQQLGIL